MRIPVTKFLFFTLSFALLTLLFIMTVPSTDYQNTVANYDRNLESTPELGDYDPDPVITKRARAEYFFNMLRDPKTNRIPPNIRSRELEHAKTIPSRREYPLRLKSEAGETQSLQFTWESEGPFDLGGRTRALGIDQRDPNTIIAGAVSGGIWKSTDGGTTWQLKSGANQRLSVSSLTQDPTNPDTWYYSSGELIGNSASARGGGSFFLGNGIYKSTDNGESWSILPSTEDNDKQFDSQFDLISRIVVSPITGTVLISSNGFGIYRSSDGQTFSSSPVLGNEAEQVFCEVAVASNGDFLGIISGATFNQGSGNNPGVYISTDDGQTWQEITPGTFPTGAYRRSVASFAPSNPNIIYILTLKEEGDTSNQGISFHKINRSTGTSEDRSDNIPNFGPPVGDMDTQGGYNMLVSVKPDDPDFVLVGGIDLFRSRDGFLTPPEDANNDGFSDDTEKDEFWVGGYAKDNDISQYPDQHPDQHVIAYDPTNPNIVWAGHDGGLSVTADITANAVTWNDKNRGYITTQFYTAALPQDPDDKRIMGGTQDNGTPFFRTDELQSQNPVSNDISFGDGSYAFFTSSSIFVSRQRGSIIRFTTTAQGDPDEFRFVHPVNATNQLFVHPYVVDPNDENIMYYPGGRTMWRNTTVTQITNQDAGGTSEGWSSFTAVDMTGYTISSLTVSRNPSNILYYGASNNNNFPKIFKIVNASNLTDMEEISIPAAASGAYIHDIEVNPANGNEILVVISNYNVESLFFSPDGGLNWEGVEGNLSSQGGNPGPSVRSATIIPAESGTIYLVGTSTGVYSTTAFDGSNTTWIQEAPAEIGNTVSEFVTSRVTDGDIAVGTHGRGMYTGSFQGSVILPTLALNPAQARVGDQVTITGDNVNFGNDPDQVSVEFGQISARIIDVSNTSITVEVPRRIIQNQDQSQSPVVQLSVTLPTGETVAGSSFTYLAPPEFKLLQNFPNPFNPSTNIAFDISVNSFVIIQIYDILGRKVLEPVSEPFEAGSWARTIDFSNMSSGVYFYRVLVFPQEGSRFTNTAQIVESRKMTFVK